MNSLRRERAWFPFCRRGPPQRCSRGQSGGRPWAAIPRDPRRAGYDPVPEKVENVTPPQALMIGAGESLRVRVMDQEPLRRLLRSLRQSAAPGCGPPDDDAHLLRRFLGGKDPNAFELLLWRHGPMVL